MEFKLHEAIQILEKTPALLTGLLADLPEGFTHNNEGPDTWSPYDVIGHLIQGEKVDWISRAKIILSDQNDIPFEPFDRFAQFDNSKGKSLEQLLSEVAELRRDNLVSLKAMQIGENDLNKKGIHPELGETTLRQLLSTWVAHDLGHIIQITRVMAKQYTEEVGPWTKYLSLFHK